MYKKILMIAVLVLVTGLLVIPSMAKEKGKSEPAGKSNIGHLYLYEKAPVSVDCLLYTSPSPRDS